MSVEKQVSIKNISSQNESNCNLFNSLGHRLIACLKAENMSFQLYRSDGQIFFSQLSSEEQQYNLSHLKLFVETCEEVQRENRSLYESEFLLLRMLRKLGLKHQSDILDKIHFDDVIEIYNSNNTQIFRNINFFKICSYSLDEVINRPWWQLYRRDDEISRQIFHYGSEILSGDLKKTINPEIGTHYLEELDSQSSFKMLIDVKYMSPLNSIQQGRTGINCLVIETTKLIN